MAITKLLRLKESTRGSPAAHLKHNLFYICNPDKCEGGIYIGGNAGTSPEIIYQTMLENKKFWGKEDGSQGFHYVISFPPELSVSEETALQIGEDFVRELLGEDFYYALVVHNDQHHMHVHITFDSVSRTDGHKFHSPKGDWEKRIQPITDRICRKYGLPVLEFTEEKKGKDYSQWKADQKEKTEENGTYRFRRDVSWYDLIRDDIDQAVRESDTFEEVLEYLRNMKYQVKLGKYLSLKPYGRERAVRTSRLGKGYSIDEIRQRVLMEKAERDPKDYFIHYGISKEILAVIRIRKQKNAGWRMTPFGRRFYQRWRNSFLRNRPDKREPWRANSDVVRVRRLSNAVKYMIDHEIDSFEDLEEKWRKLQKQKAGFRAEHSALTTKLYRRSPLGELSRYEKLKTQTEGKPSAEESKEMASLFLRIEAAMGIEKARALREELKCQISVLKEKEKQIREEEKLLEDLYTFYFEMNSPIQEKSRRKERTPNKDSPKTAVSGNDRKTEKEKEDHTQEKAR